MAEHKPFFHLLNMKQTEHIHSTQLLLTKNPYICEYVPIVEYEHG